MWRIRRTEADHRDRIYWSQEYGWTWLEYADTFTEAGKADVDMPRGGVWEEVL